MPMLCFQSVYLAVAVAVAFVVVIVVLAPIVDVVALVIDQAIVQIHGRYSRYSAPFIQFNKSERKFKKS